MDNPLIIALAVATGIISAARLTRLFTQDSFPPAAWLRMKWDEITKDGAWAILAHCHWCLAPYMVAFVGLWGWLSGLHVLWWVINAWLAASYIASMIVERDEVS
jgi:hypothetical protein